MHRLLIIAVSLAVAGCLRRPDIVANSTSLPAVVAGRTLWNTASAGIYARDEQVAAETQAWIEALNGHVMRTYDRRLGRGMVVVTDIDDDAVIDTVAELIRLEALLPGRVAKAVSPDERRQRLSDAGMTEEMALQLAIVMLDDAALKKLGIPVDTAGACWRLSCPSQRLAARHTQSFAPKALAKKKGRAFAVLAAPLVPVAAVEAAKVFWLARDSLAFDLWCAEQTDWTASQRAAASTRYLKERAFVISPLLSLAMSMAQQEATKATASAPTTAPAASP